MASLNVSAEELSCAVCCEIFKDPVILSCSHSVCKECLLQFWRIKETQECPLCRKRSSRDDPPYNLALKNLCEPLWRQRNERCSSGSEEICSLHGEKLKLFCLEDKQPVCLVCRDSQKYINHTFRPINEVVSSYKVGQYNDFEGFCVSQYITEDLTRETDTWREDEKRVCENSSTHQGEETGSRLKYPAISTQFIIIDIGHT
uniref:Uncharacterized protein n=1 Tax=Cyprinus carpio TaxID=7962 RepID=A0A8C2Q282_CYPCA